MARRKPNLDELLKKLGYRFEKPELLDEALTHVSAPQAAGQSYQRLEFLGDRVLGLAIAELLFKTFPSAPEGELSRRLAELVRRESCAEIAIAWDVGPYLKLGAGEAHSGERRNQTILADVCEAIIGAVFLDGGYEAARNLVERSFQSLLEAPRRPLRDPKSALQEWAQGRGLPPPTYSIAEQTGPDHAPRFRVVVKVKGSEGAFGQGASKRVAEQAAARSLLLREGVWTEDEHGTA
ncbi:ribonuclease III [Microvirga sp. CF3016]|uniref:ribonuclease III n=1 Tax=Microvirga sp. CF3016 TaxID=3110181 RepID=UPI002E789507|nr:ribonuclease III [Microvirga sp. CF3016]MEE1611622.1 ribonuclease III [Microvirga sp. CF3016]